jgi:hypothetical protein
MEMTDEQFRQHALETLQKTLGAGGFACFLRVYRPRSGDYTRDRRKWQQGFTVRQIAEEIKNRRENHASLHGRFRNQKMPAG